MYKFVKIKRRGSDTSHWYFRPSSEEQVIEHFKTIFGAEIRDGVKDRMEHCHLVKDNSPQGFWVYNEHPITPWARAVESLGFVGGLSWLETAVNLENKVLKNRIKDFNDGKEMYLDNGVVETFMVEGDEIVDEIEKDTLTFPIEEQCRLEEVRYIQWNMPDLPTKGTHWYAKIGRLDIKDKDGNMKWNTKAEAEEAAKWYIENKIFYKRYNG